MLEAARQDKTVFASGGSTGRDIKVSTTVDNSELKGPLMEMIKAQREANDKKVVIVYKNMEEFETTVTEIRNSSAA